MRCPPPLQTEAERRRAQSGGKVRKNVLRTLAERHRVVYAPGSEIGSVTVDSEVLSKQVESLSKSARRCTSTCRSSRWASRRKGTPSGAPKGS